MAFQQSQRLQLYRPAPAFTPRNDADADASLTQAQPPTFEDSQEWILFAPDTHSSVHQTTSTARTQITAGRSRLSDFGSLETVARSGSVHPGEHGFLFEDENEDLDSLDDGLHAFHEAPRKNTIPRTVGQSADTVLPSHDGQGMFPTDPQSAQDQRYTHQNLRSSFRRQVQSLEEEASDALAERMRRIEKWRIEQSRAILDEVEKETKRRRMSLHAQHEEYGRAQNTLGVTSINALPQAQEPLPSTTPERDSFWTRFTRRVIRDLMGMDDATLTYIFGEDLPPEGQDRSPIQSPVWGLVSQAERTIPNNGSLTRVMASWEDRLLARVAKELGTFINQLTEHPGAFSTYLRTQEAPPYAGIPTPGFTTSRSSAAQPADVALADATNPQFTPTLAQRRFTSTTDPSLWGIEEQEEAHNHLHTDSSVGSAAKQPTQPDREYWEKDLDVKMVFGFLRDLLSSKSDANHPTSSDTTPTTVPQRAVSSHPAQGASSSLRRAALIRHHHPLISRKHRNSIAANPNIAPGAQFPHTRLVTSPILGRRPNSLYDEDMASTCASHSTKKSKTAHTVSSGRNYWDIGAGGLRGSAVSVVSVGSGGGWLD